MANGSITDFKFLKDLFYLHGGSPQQRSFHQFHIISFSNIQHATKAEHSVPAVILVRLSSKPSLLVLASCSMSPQWNSPAVRQAEIGLETRSGVSESFFKEEAGKSWKKHGNAARTPELSSKITEEIDGFWKRQGSWSPVDVGTGTSEALYSLSKRPPPAPNHSQHRNIFSSF